jgi:hypothetical protein
MEQPEVIVNTVPAPDIPEDPDIFHSKFNDFAILLGIMHERKLSEFDARCVLASKIIEEWMTDPDVRMFIHEKSANYVHDKGYSQSKLFKEEHTIPLEAFLVLPAEIRHQPKRLMRWLKQNHRYLVFK